MCIFGIILTSPCSRDETDDIGRTDSATTAASDVSDKSPNWRETPLGSSRSFLSARSRSTSDETEDVKEKKKRSPAVTVITLPKSPKSPPKASPFSFASRMKLSRGRRSEGLTASLYWSIEDQSKKLESMRCAI